VIFNIILLLISFFIFIIKFRLLFISIIKFFLLKISVLISFNELNNPVLYNKNNGEIFIFFKNLLFILKLFFKKK